MKTPPPPTESEAMEIAEQYFHIAETIAEADKETAVRLLEEYFTADASFASLQLWYFASLGPVLVAAALRKANKDVLGPDDFWGIEELPGAEPTDPSTLAAMQAVAAQLNGDQAASWDVMSAHFDVVTKRSGMSAAHDAMFDMVLVHLQMLAALIKEGVFR